MLDRKQFEIRVCSGMPSNVIYGINKDWLANGNSDIDEAKTKVNSYLQDIIRAYASDHPDYIIESRYAPYGSSYGLDTFRFYAKGENIGELSVNSKGRYAVASPMIRRELERGSCRETKDRKKLIKLMRTFIPKSTDEKMSEAMSKIQSRMYREYHDKRSDFTDAYKTVCRYIEQYVRDNWETISSAVLTGGGTTGNIEAFNKAMEPHDTAKYIHWALENGKAVMVHIEDGVYCVSNPPFVNPEKPVGKYTMYSSSESLPVNIRRNIGMLKLMSEYECMAGVGYKADDNQFVVLLGDGNE